MSRPSIRCSTDSRSTAGSSAGGWRRQSSADGATTASHHRVGRPYAQSNRVGKTLWRSSVASPESSMADWRHVVRTRLTELRLTAAAESELTEELAQHLEDL